MVTMKITIDDHDGNHHDDDDDNDDDENADSDDCYQYYAGCDSVQGLPAKKA